MGVVTSLLLIAIGAVLRFAISVSTHGFNIHTIGIILMIVGAIGLIISLFWMAVWRDRRTAGPRYVERDGHPGYGEPPASGY